MIAVNERRFLHDLHLLASIGLVPNEQGGGRDRRAFSAPEREARRLFASLAEDAGLEVRTDSGGKCLRAHGLRSAWRADLAGRLAYGYRAQRRPL